MASSGADHAVISLSSLRRYRRPDRTANVNGKPSLDPSPMPKRAIASDRVFKPSLPFAQATVAGGFMFVCSTGRDREGRFAIGDVRAQTQQTLDNIRALIEQAGGSIADVVKCTVYVTDRANWAPMNEVYFANFAEDPPHRVSCIVTGLGSPDCLVEIDATAFLGDAAQA
jgi:enamine deaminase RidA (YjgF/YER057c/UK114 family)